LKKIIRVVSIVICLLGITSIAAVQAAQPHQHLSYGDIQSTFQTFLGPPPSKEAQAGIIVPYDDEMGDFCVEDAHGIMFGWIMYPETHEEALEFWKMEVKDGLILTEFVLNGEPLENEYTSLKRFWYHPDAHYWYWYGIGVLFKPGELPVGEYILETSISIYFDEWIPFVYWNVGFTICDCWH